jgi:hypothetical protein
VWEGLISGRESILEVADGYFLEDNSGEPIKFFEAYNHPKPDARLKLITAICKECEDIKKKGVWGVIPKAKTPEGRRCVKRKLVLKIKRNEIFMARLMACGCSQVPGVDFTEVIHQLSMIYHSELSLLEWRFGI